MDINGLPCSYYVYYTNHTESLILMFALISKEYCYIIYSISKIKPDVCRGIGHGIRTLSQKEEYTASTGN